MTAATWSLIREQSRAKSRHTSDTTAELASELSDYELLVTASGTTNCVPLSRNSELLIGRAEEATLRLVSGGISRYHAKVHLRDAELSLMDLGSSNGTFLRGKRLEAHSETSVAPGEAFLVGDCVLFLRARRQRVAYPRKVNATSASDVVLHAPSMLELYRQAETVARSGISVLVLGETGVGKDVLASKIHERSSRCQHAFLRLNCAAFSESLLESELFGHEKGAFTGAICRKPGLLSTATGGTVFLDEVGEIPLALQAKLLQVLENQAALSVGGTKPQPIDVRFIAATNRNLEREVEEGRFRSDLYFRLAAFTFLVPPLRSRKEEILPLARAFLRSAGEKRLSPTVPNLHSDAAAWLLNYEWPGNVRELRNMMERALVLSEGMDIRVDHLPAQRFRTATPGVESGNKPTDGTSAAVVTYLSREELDDRRRIIDALSSCAGNQSKAAKSLGLSRSTLINRLGIYRIDRPRKRAT